MQIPHVTGKNSTLRKEKMEEVVVLLFPLGQEISEVNLTKSVKIEGKIIDIRLLCVSEIFYSQNT